MQFQKVLLQRDKFFLNFGRQSAATQEHFMVTVLVFNIQF